MNDLDRRRIKDIKAKVSAMLEERASYPHASPSKLWSAAASTLDYMLGMDEAEFARLRLHTYRFTGDNPETYWGDAEAFRALHKDEINAYGVPPEYRINEPEDGIGFHYDWRFISLDIIRFQRVIDTLYRRDIFGEMERRARALTISPHVLEIGAGYGGLAHHISNIVKGKSVYVIVDLPETLLYSASYLALHNPNKKLYLHEKGRGIDGSEDFILIPHYRLDLLKYWKFDLVLNVASMQEMRTDQVETYLDFISKTCIGLFYSLNLDCYSKNTELSCLSDLLNAQFDTVEVGAPAGYMKYSPPKSARLLLLERLSAIYWKIMFLEVAPALGIEAKPDTRCTVEREYFCRVKGWQNNQNVSAGLKR